ncbi:hypothetical protein C8F01DRAFT_1300924 [Mycena amicta]|nr:hypothetical protein C8F01DRAFT_1300924 [Mycena amicta]
MAGSGATAVGYIGCFNLVQTASSHQTFIWLGLEAALCLTRIFIWSANPRWDENIWATLTLRSPVRPKQTSTSRSYEQILSAKAKDGGGGDDHPFSVEPLEYLHPRRPMLALPDVYPWDYGSIYYALASPARGDCLYLFTVWLPWPTPSFGVVKNTAFIFVQKTGQDTAIAFYHAHLIMAGRRESKILLGSEIERSEATSRLVGMKSKGTNVDPQECLTKMLEDSREILSQFPDPTATTQEMYVSLSGNLRSFRWDE